MKKLDGRTALVTGASTRIGKQIAINLAKQGANLIIHYNRSREEAIKTQKELQEYSTEILLVQADLMDVVSISRMIEQIKSKYIFFDILVNNASSFILGTIKESSVEDWDKSFAVNVRAPFLLTKFMAQLYFENKPKWEGNIINIGDHLGYEVWTSYSHHGTSKAALHHFTRLAAKEFAPDIRVNAIIPGMLLPPPKFDANKWNNMTSKLPLKRAGGSEAVIKTINYILDNEYITGTLIRIDGGESLLSMSDQY